MPAGGREQGQQGEQDTPFDAALVGGNAPQVRRCHVELRDFELRALDGQLSHGWRQRDALSVVGEPEGQMGLVLWVVLLTVHLTVHLSAEDELAKLRELPKVPDWPLAVQGFG